jgi:hypothetical protein
MKEKRRFPIRCEKTLHQEDQVDGGVIDGRYE